VRKSGKTVARCTTAEAQGCTLTVEDLKDPDHEAPFAVIARKGNDVTYLRYEDLRIDTGDSDVSGESSHDAAYHASVFSERGAYRPGDIFHAIAIVHDKNDVAPTAPVPATVNVIDSHADVVRSVQVNTNASGMVSVDYALPPFAKTGHWRVDIKIADNVIAGSDFYVEEFVPQRMQLTVKPTATDVISNDPVKFDIKARYLFGGTAVDSEATLTCQMTAAQFSPNDSDTFAYGVEVSDQPIDFEDNVAKLPAEGSLQLPCGSSKAGAVLGQTATVTATVSVFEAGSGRATVEEATTTMHPERFYLGLKTEDNIVRVGRPVSIIGKVVDWDGKLSTAATDTVAVEVSHGEVSYQFSFDAKSGKLNDSEVVQAVVDERRTVKVVNGTFVLEVTPKQVDQGISVRVTAKKATTVLELRGDAGDDHDGDDEDDDYRRSPSSAPGQPKSLRVAVPSELNIGEPVTVHVRAPYPGRMLWTTESDHVLSEHWQDVGKGEVSWTFTVEKFTPTVYVSAFIVKDPHGEGTLDYLPDRAFGVSPIFVVPSPIISGIRLDAPKEVRSSSALTITVSGEPHAFAVVSAVDEGILSLTKFETPDPAADLHPQRSLEVETFETVGWTMLHRPGSSHTGGSDDGGVNGGRIQPVKSVALFSGIVQLGADGRLTVPFRIPSYRGKLRVVAITAGASKIGRAQTEVVVKDPLVAQMTFPRFLTANDEIDVPVMLSNMSGGPLAAVASLSSSNLPTGSASKAPLISIDSTPQPSISLKDGETKVVVFHAKAVGLAAAHAGVGSLGGAHIKLLVHANGRAGSFDVGDEVDVPILSAGSTGHSVEKLRVVGGAIDVAALAKGKDGFIPQTQRTTLWLTTNPFSESFEHLRFLLHYPHGCIEQTTSSTMPLLYLATVVPQIEPDISSSQVDDMISAGITRVFSMQTSAGGFAYWPGESDAVAWGTAYATHMLLDASKRGYAVPKDRLKAALDWIEQRVSAVKQLAKDDPSPDYDREAVPYLHYVLALAGRGDKARIASLLSPLVGNMKGVQLEAVFMLKAALYLAGDRRYEKELRALDASAISEERSNSWSFYSELRSRGFMLSTFADLFGNDAQAEPLAQQLARSLSRTSSSYTTQELVWSVTGLGKWMSSVVVSDPSDATLVADGATLQYRRDVKAKAVAGRTWVVENPNDLRSLNLNVPATSAGAWLLASREGVFAGPPPVGGNRLSIKRSYRDLYGDEINLAANDLKLGDVVFVEDEVSNSSPEYVENLALVDRVPAGFEIENARLGRKFRPDWLDKEQQWQTQYIDQRDDRVSAFGGLEPKQSKKFVFAVRVVTAGHFAVPVVEIEAMYDPRIWARAAGGTAVIASPWNP
jgi:alpha-2-macroglobulin